jgi:hypothetical protein
LITTGTAYAAIPRRLIAPHQEWMVRNCVVTFGFVFCRMLFTALRVAKVGTPPEELVASAWFRWSVQQSTTLPSAASSLAFSSAAGEGHPVRPE